MHRESNEQTLQTDLRNGNFSAFWQLWQIHKNKLFSICLKLMKGSYDDAEDALSTAMLKASEKIPIHIAKIKNITGWLSELTLNICIDLLRKKKELLCDNFPDSLVHSGREFFMNISPSPEKKFLMEKKIELICLEINRLPPRLREPMMLHFFLKMSYKEIAFELNITHENVRKRIQQARDLLQGKLKVYFPDITRYFSMIIDMSTESLSWKNFSQQAGRILKRNISEMHDTFTTTILLRIPIVGGIERSIVIFFKKKPQRIETRLKTLREYVRRYPGGWKRQVELADILYARGDWDQAVRHYRLALEKHPQILQVMMNLGDIFLKTERNAEAEELYKKALNYAHQIPSKHHLHGMINICRKQWRKAIQSFGKAAALDSGNCIHMNQVGYCYLQMGNTAEASDVFDQALQINPNNLAALTNSYECLVKTGRIAEAEKRVERVLNIYPQDILALKRMVDLRCQRGFLKSEQGKKTRKLLGFLVQSAPNSVEARESMAIYYYYRGDIHQALDLLKRFSAEHDICPECWNTYASWLYRCGYYQAAADSIMKSYSLCDRNLEIFHLACKVLPMAGMTEQLKPLLEKMLLSFPRHWCAVCTAGFTLVNTYNEILQGINISSRAIELQPHLHGAYFSHGQVLMTAGKFTEAVNMFKKGLKLLPPHDHWPHSTRAVWLLARSYQALDNNEQARSEFQKVIRGAHELKNNIPAQGFYLEGMAWYELGEQKKAGSALNRALDFGLFQPSREKVEKILKKIGG